MTLEEAENWVKSRAATAQEPCLTDDDITDCINQNKRYEGWESAEAYSVGTLIVPSLHGTAAWNGRQYRCIESGTASTFSPIWPTNSNAHRGQIVRDGSTIWEDAGEAFGNQWDVRGAVGSCWIIKAGRAAHEHSFKAEGQSFDRQQIFEHCVQMARQYGKVYVG